MTRGFGLRCAAIAALTVGAVLAGTGTRAIAEDVTLEVWSHEADEPAKVAFRELAVKNFEKSHPGTKVKITWYEKNPLSAALKTALPAGKGPDVFYVEPDQVEYITAGYVVPLDDTVNWNQIEPWARKVWIKNGKTYGQLTQTQFLDLVKKARAAGMTPIAQGVGDRPYPGAYITVEALLRRLGPDDYEKLFSR